MMTAGMALEAFIQWAGTPSTLVLFPSYCVRGTLGYRLLAGAKEVTLDAPPGVQPPTYKLAVACAVEQISFSAHADAKGILGLARQLRPQAVVVRRDGANHAHPLTPHAHAALAALFALVCSWCTASVPRWPTSR